MFLKQIKLQGFKSFAEKTVINFESEYTGIVGPNGCGKSNIIDAIRWVLGEQSAKNMRGSSMSDVVFAGSEFKKGVNLAEVTLVFDNSNHQINSDYEEIEVTRRLYKSTNESEYLINNTPCRLKDIVDLTLDTGLGKDSLSIISQNAITQFAESKPIERRALFEEAAGVAKYKKRKIESLSKLTKTQENIDRLSDVLNELEKQVSPLKRQAIKAQQYIEKKARLTEIEVAVLVNDIVNYNSDIDTIEKQSDSLNYEETSTKANIQIIENDVNDFKDEMNTLDSEITSLQDRVMRTVDEIRRLDKRKVEIDEKRRYLVERGTTEQKIQETKNLLDSAQQEYEDRLNRKEEIVANINMLTGNINGYNYNLNQDYDKLREVNDRIYHLKSRKSTVENLANSPNQAHGGVNTVLKNKNVLPGIYDTVANLFKVDEGYEVCISTALSAALYNIVTKDSESAKTAIKFLKKNKSGQATFLPLNVMKPHSVNNDHLYVAQHTDGFCGVAEEFVECDSKFDNIVLSLLGNVLVADNIDHGNDLAKRLNFNYKIVTLDGDVIHRGGSLQGGYNKTVNSPLTYGAQLKEIEKDLAVASSEYDEIDSRIKRNTKLRDEQEDLRVQAKVSLASINEVIDVKRDKYEKLKEEYDRIKPDNEQAQQQSYEDELLTQLNNAYRLKDELTSTIATKRDRRSNANNEHNRKYAQLRQLRNELSSITDKVQRNAIAKATLIAKRDSLIDRLARDYSQTFEFAVNQTYDVDIDAAKLEVVELRNEIAALGNVNLDAPQSYEEVNERYTFMTNQLNDLNNAKSKLLEVINEMDDVMTTLFKESFDSINNQLSGVFAALFGGGKAKLILEDPDDILNTGIDISVQPPGKNVQNIRLFSGGEKSLIAICVLFAILKARPIPLCIFDEVEASLDQGNVERFAKYIHQFANQSQFIVITHRPGTMTECDVLYGVTMQHRGISSVLRVKLKEAIEDFSEGEDSNGSIQ